MVVHVKQMKMKETEVQMQDANPDKLHENCNLNDNHTNSSEVKSKELVQGKEKKKGKKKKKSAIIENCTEIQGNAIADNCTELEEKPKKRIKKKIKVDSDNLEIEAKSSQENCTETGTTSETVADLQVKKKKKMKKGDNNIEADKKNNNDDNSFANIESKSIEDNSISKEVVGTVSETGTNLPAKKKKKKRKGDNNLEVDKSNNDNLEVNNNDKNNLEIDNNNSSANIESKSSKENSISEEIVGTVSETGTHLQAKKKKKKKQGEKCDSSNKLKADNTEADNINNVDNNNDENNNALNIESKSIEDNCNSKETVGTTETEMEKNTETGTNSQGKKRKRKKKIKGKINNEIVPKTRNNILLVLDINGLLADINSEYEFAEFADTKISRKLVFLRPFCEEFLNFCFDNFKVGIWSSRLKNNVDKAVQFLMGDDRRKNLVFCWDQSQCTATNFKTVDNADKPIVFKELRKLWEKESPNLPWEKGDFGPSNTLLIDDSPYKAFCNPPYTAIFPQPYCFKDYKTDNSLGEGGDLRVYLEKLLTVPNVQYFVKDNPFGQPAISDSDPFWKYYIKIIDSLDKPLVNSRLI